VNAPLSRVAAKSETDLMQECMSAMLNETRKLDDVVSGKSAELIDKKVILEYSEKAQEIHAKIAKSFNPNEGRSKILERFFTQWNNMLFGLFYVAGELETKGFVTAKQFEIFTASLDEIVKTLEKNPILARRQASAREQQAT